MAKCIDCGQGEPMPLKMVCRGCQIRREIFDKITVLEARTKEMEETIDKTYKLVEYLYNNRTQMEAVINQTNQIVASLYNERNR